MSYAQYLNFGSNIKRIYTAQVYSPLVNTSELHSETQNDKVLLSVTFSQWNQLHSCRHG
jgi:hypothetical protein